MRNLAAPSKPSLADQAKKILLETVIHNRWIPEAVKAQGFPSTKQAIFLVHPAHEIFYGGAAGGGKSWGILAAALQYVDWPGYAALIVRRTFTDLAKPEGLVSVSHEWLGNTHAHWDGTQHEWRFPGGAKLCFGHMEAEKDKFRYKSAAYQFVAFDELTQFTKSQYTFLFSRQRRTLGSRVPIRMRSASNPGEEGHEWVKEYFINSRADDRVFIPAKLTENPGLDVAEYRKSLAKLDLVTRRQMEDGDWDIQPEGNMFKRSWFEIINAAPADVLARCRAWDLAATKDGGDWLVGTRMSRTRFGLYVIENVIREQLAPLTVETQLKQTAVLDGRLVRIRGEQEPAASGKIVAAAYTRMLAGYDVAFSPSSGEKVTRWRPFSAQCEAGNVKLLAAPWNEGWLERLERVPQKGVPDDEADSASGAFNDLSAEFVRAADDLGYTF